MTTATMTAPTKAIGEMLDSIYEGARDAELLAADVCRLRRRVVSLRLALQGAAITAALGWMMFGFMMLWAACHAHFGHGLWAGWGSR